MFSFFSFVSRYRMRTKRIELKFSLKLPTMLLHQVGSGQLDRIRIRAAPIRSSTILWILINPLTISRIFSARWTPNATFTTYKQFGTLHDLRIHRIGRRIGSKSIANAICWRFLKFFRPDGHQRCWPCTNNIELLTIFGSIKSVRKRWSV